MFSVAGPNMTYLHRNLLPSSFACFKSLSNNSTVVLDVWGSGQGRKQHGISTFLTFSHIVMLQSADWRTGFYLHGKHAKTQAPLHLQHNITHR